MVEDLLLLCAAHSHAVLQPPVTLRTHAEVLEWLAPIAPVTAVRGNVDDGPDVDLPQHVVLRLAGWTMLVLHIAGMPPKGGTLLDGDTLGPSPLGMVPWQPSLECGWKNCSLASSEPLPLPSLLRQSPRKHRR